jgi:hypothetical protein
LSNAKEDCFVLDKDRDIFRLKPEYESFWKLGQFRELVKDRAEFVLARYFLRTRLQQTIYYSPSIISNGFPINRKFAEAVYDANPLEPGEKREITVRCDQNAFTADLAWRSDDNKFWLTYEDASPIAEFLRRVLTPAPENGEKAFTLIAEGRSLRIELPGKAIDLRGIVVDIPYNKSPDTGLTAEFRKALTNYPSQSEWEISFERTGYDGAMEIEIIEGDAFKAWTATRFKDKSRFPARIKAAATALLHEGFRGEFRVTAKGKRVLVSKLTKQA